MSCTHLVQITMQLIRWLAVLRCYTQQLFVSLSISIANCFLRFHTRCWTLGNVLPEIS